MSRHLRWIAPLIEAALVLGLAQLPAARTVLPVLGLLTGPLGALLALAALLVAWQRAGFAWPRPRVPPAWLLFLLSAMVCSALALWYSRHVEPSGDEIDYLMMAQSVWREADLDLRDNFARGDFLEYLGGLDRMPGSFQGADGRYHPIHSGGFAVLLAPTYALAGRAGCCVLQALLAACLGLLVRGLARGATGSERAGLAAWAAAVGPPVLYYTSFLYTEVAVALCLALALRLLLSERLGAAGAALAALALSALPWLHVRMTLASVVIGGWALIRLRGRTRISFLVSSSLMAAVYTASQYSIYRTLSPFARYGGATPLPVVNSTPGRTLVGLFLDGAYGLLPYAPVFLLAFAGAWVLPRREARERWLVVLAALGVLLPVLGWRNWWGFSPPARFVIPLVPVLALPLAWRVAEAPERGLARWRWPLAAAATAFVLLVFVDPEAMRMINGRDGTSHGYDALAGAVSFSRYLPFLSSRLGSVAPPWEPPPAEARVAAVWVGALLVLLVLDRLAISRPNVDRWFSGLTLPLAFLLALSLAVDLWARPRVGTPQRQGFARAGLAPADPLHPAHVRAQGLRHLD